MPAIKKPRTTVYPNAVQVRSHNKSVTVMNDEGNYRIELLQYDPEHANQASVEFMTLRGKVRVNSIYLSPETMADIVRAYRLMQERRPA